MPYPTVCLCLRVLLLACAVAAPTLTLRAQRQMEALGRGVIALNQGSGKIYVGWRLLGTDPTDIAFNLYRVTGAGAAVKLNPSPLTVTTDFLDTAADTTQPLRYFVRPVLGGSEQFAGDGFAIPANAPANPYLSIPLTPPEGGTTPDNVAYTYTANDCSAADLDGDGEYEIVLKWDPTNAKDNSQSGYTGPVFLDALKLNGTRLWRINLGRNIRAGAHYTQFIAYDLDGDGRAEIACKTADGTTDGAGTVIGDAAADYRNGSGYVLSGPEFLTIFDGRTGAALATTEYVPARGDVSAWGDSYGNRVDRFLAAVAYLDGERPSLVMCRGYYTRAVLAAWDWRGGQFTQRWVFDSNDGTLGNADYQGEGNHNLSVADVDQDGRDEIIYGSAAIDHDGRGLYSTELHHGDALHVSDLDPARAGLEVWACHEDYANNGGRGLTLRDARTGAVLFSVPSLRDTGRALAADIDPGHAGYELWGAAGGLYSSTGVQIADAPPKRGTSTLQNFAVWWDADPLRELFDGGNNDGGSTTAPYVQKWNPETRTSTEILSATGCFVNNWTKANPGLVADLVGDWREEILLRSSDNRELRVYSTMIAATSRLYTLMHDPQYRLAIAWQNVAYNQPPHPGFFLGHGMSAAPRPNIRLVAAPAFNTQPTAHAVPFSTSLTLTAAASRPSTYQWHRNGVVLPQATAATLTLPSLQPIETGLYTLAATSDLGATISEPAIIGGTSATKTVGAGTEVGPDIKHPNGRYYDQVLLEGAALAVKADPGQTLRVSFIDLTDDIVQVEFAGPGTLSLTLAGASGPAAPTRYTQAQPYMKGLAGIVITGATEETNVSAFTVGRATAFDRTEAYDILQSISPTNNPANNGSPLFVGQQATVYDGFADLAFIAISSSNGKFGGVRTANGSYYATAGLTGVYAPGVEFTGPVYVHDIRASEAATPVLRLGSAANVQVTGGDLEQANGRAVLVSGITQLRFANGSDSHGHVFLAQANRARLEQDGTDVTAAIVVNPSP